MEPKVEEHYMFDHQAKSIADSVLILAISRVSMVLALPTIAFIAWLGGQWLDQRFNQQDAKIVAQSIASTNQNTLITARIESTERTTGARVETVERSASARADTVERSANAAIEQAAKVNDRLIAVEANQAQNFAASERFQNGALQRLDRMQDSIILMSNAIAALTATLQAEKDKESRSNSR
ncbi:MAG TPA: hypothetical protein VF944_07780 [Candidatus Bathyarchaeia archaeon]